MTISTINRDNAYETFQYLPKKDIIECGKVNKHWKQMIEKNEKKLFSKDFLVIKGARDAFIRTRHLLEAVNREIKALEEFFANPENQVGLLEMGLSSFSFANEKCASYRDQMQLRIEKNELLGKLKADSYRLSCINRVEKLTLKKFNNHLSIMQLFGGREEYNKLPIIDISHIQPQNRDQIDFISPTDMERVDPKASIMRGFDGHEREFFTIKFNVVKDGNDAVGPYSTTIFQRDKMNQELWLNASETISLPFEGYVIFDRVEPSLNVDYKKLATLISTGMVIDSKTREVFLLA